MVVAGNEEELQLIPCLDDTDVDKDQDLLLSGRQLIVLR